MLQAYFNSEVAQSLLNIIVLVHVSSIDGECQVHGLINDLLLWQWIDIQRIEFCQVLNIDK